MCRAMYHSIAKLFSAKYPYKAMMKVVVTPLSFYKGPIASSLIFTQVGQSFIRGHDDFNILQFHRSRNCSFNLW